ncbi:MAG: SPOR domain-containing protein [Hydrogenovibrio sp.]|uniref:SPOR domain-containing protein n=1 Tax=Hydrogenovibrio sp. TaxID=2065821 RepID=UPI002870ADBA|nr:SPOR domain-containing protein [Hydrogenovibrio sp.]MDR9499893.1 SPOR domain-containing protein [Hydrogenovibrio sp.]
MLYDPVSGKMITAEQAQKMQAQELLFEVSADSGVALGELALQEIDGRYWIDLPELIRWLDFPIEIESIPSSDNQPPALSAEGWFIEPDNGFSLKTKTDGDQLTYQVVAKEQTFTLTQDALAALNSNWYFPFQNVMTWFDIDYSIKRADLQMVLMPSQPLPLEARMRRMQRQGASLRSDFSVQFPRRDVPYQALDSAFADIQFNAAQDYGNNKRYRLSALGSGDLAYMTGRYFVSHRYNERIDQTDTNLRLSLERNDIDSSLLGPLQASHVSLGDISTVPITNLPSGGNDVGFRVSNRPYGRVTNSSTTNITGFQQPGWDVELYLNEIFLGAQTVGEDGQYQFFNQPLSAGENVFTLRFFGPQGQREETTETFLLDQSALVGGKLIYDLSFSKQDWQLFDYFDDEKDEYRDEDRYRFNLHMEKGLGNNVSLTTDVTQFQFSDGTDHQFVQPGVRLFLWDTLFNVNYLKDLDAGSLTNFSVSRAFGSGGQSHQLSYNARFLDEDFKTDASDQNNRKQTHTITLQGPLWHPDESRLRLNYQLKADRLDYYDDTESQGYQFNLGANYGRFNATHNLRYAEYTSSDGVTSDRLNGNFQLNAGLGRLYLRSGFSYEAQPQSELQNANLDVLWNLGNGFKTEVGYGYNFLTEQGVQDYSLNWQNKSFTTSLRVSRTEEDTRGSINFRFGLGYEPLRNQLRMSSRNLSSTGAVSAFVFEDKNNNQIYEEGEQVIEGATVEAVQQRRRAQTDEEGVAYIQGLYGTQPTDVQLDQSSLPDPFWIPSQKGISFLPRPGLVKTLLIPVVTAGEVEGTVTFAEGLFDQPINQGRVPMQLTNLETDETMEVQSAFDGFYLFSQVPPGKYHLNAAPEFLESNDLKTRSDMPVTIGADGTLIMGANFELFPEDKYAYTQDSISQENSYAIDLGTFVSENNAKTVLSVLRGLFPSLLSKYQNRTPYEVLLSKKADDQYQLVLGPFFDLNQPKYVCGALASENLHCRIQKNAVETPEQAPAEKTASVSAMPAASEPNPNAHTTAVTDAPVVQEEVLADTSSKKPASKPVSTPQPQLAADEGFTIQLVSVSSRTAAKGFIERYRLKQTQIEPKTVNGREMFAVLVGQFASRAEAKEAAEPIEVHTGKAPWVRPMAL